MSNITFPIINIDNEKYEVIIDLNIYTKEAIIATTYKFTNQYYIHQITDTKNSNLVRVTFESKNGKIINDNDPKIFCNELIDQQVRYNTNIQFGHIRDMIVEEAFKPVNSK